MGCSPAWPDPGGAHSGYLVDDPAAGNTHGVLLDCGPGVLARLRSRDGWPHVDAVVITHFHLDHWGDLVPWVWGTFYGLGRRETHPELWLPPNGGAFLAEIGSHLGFPDMFERAFQVREYAENTPFQASDFEITALRLPHYRLETYGLRVRGESATLAYSGDSGPDERLATLASDVDLFLCEATLRRGEDDGEPRGHLSAEEALAAAAAGQAHRTVLIHRPLELPTPEGIERAHDGLELTV
jgi:ribonuclease BN (tRNA processing enzyme)